MDNWALMKALDPGMYSRVDTCSMAITESPRPSFRFEYPPSENGDGEVTGATNCFYDISDRQT